MVSKALEKRRIIMIFDTESGRPTPPEYFSAPKGPNSSGAFWTDMPRSRRGNMSMKGHTEQSAAERLDKLNNIYKRWREGVISQEDTLFEMGDLLNPPASSRKSRKKADDDTDLS
jgi:hypothetical protein